MGRKRPERDQVETLLKEDRRRKAHDIAEEAGLIETMGYDKAVDYVRRVKRDMKKAGAFPEEKYKFASDSDRLEDITKLFELRQGKEVSQKVTYMMLMLNCYYRLRSEDDTIHMGAIDDTYDKSDQLNNLFDWHAKIGICEFAMERYIESIDMGKREAAIKRGLPGAGLNYTSETLIEKLAITDEELQHMKSIKRG